MRIADTVGMALEAIARNKVRSSLTALGVIIGVASVVAMVHLGQAATQSVTDQISSMGSNLLFIRPGAGGRGPGGLRAPAEPFELADVAALRSVEGVRVAPGVTAARTVVYGNANMRVAVTGSDNEFFAIRSWKLERGRFFEPGEVSAGTPVCVIGQSIVEELFGDANPLGETLRVGRPACLVIGILAAKGSSFGNDEDEIIVMPAKAVQRRVLGSLDVHTIYVSALVDGTTARVQRDLELVMRERRGIRPGDEDDFRVRDMAEISEALQGTTATLTALLGAIAAVSLLVGGIGIMNIMLVSVTERTREIGIRLAIGAQSRDVLQQFLVESIVLSTFGGILGLILGIAGTYLATQQMNLPFVLSTETMAIGFSFSVVIGVVFGYVPARKAARLNPIDALRHE